MRKTDFLGEFLQDCGQSTCAILNDTTADKCQRDSHVFVICNIFLLSI